MDNLERIENKLDEVIDILKGDPTNKNNPGVLIRLDRSEHSIKGLKIIVFLLGSGLVTTIGSLIVGIILKCL